MVTFEPTLGHELLLRGLAATYVTPSTANSARGEHMRWFAASMNEATAVTVPLVVASPGRAPPCVIACVIPRLNASHSTPKRMVATALPMPPRLRPPPADSTRARASPMNALAWADRGVAYGAAAVDGTYGPNPRVGTADGAGMVRGVPTAGGSGCRCSVHTRPVQ